MNQFEGVLKRRNETSALLGNSLKKYAGEIFARLATAAIGVPRSPDLAKTAMALLMTASRRRSDVDNDLPM